MITFVAFLILAAMPKLRNQRHETFVNKLIRNAHNGLNQRQAYEQSGYIARGSSADACASRLLSSAKVKQRMSELSAPAVRKSTLSLEALLVEVERTLADARADRAHSACVQALGLVVKIHELVVHDRGIEQEFAGAKTPNEIFDLIVDEFDGLDKTIEQFETMLNALRDRAADRATPINQIGAPKKSK